MRLVGQKTFFDVRGFRLGALFLCIAGFASPLLGQTAPYVLPYTMSTFAGPHAGYTIGAACTNTNVTPVFTEPTLVALDTEGDGCLAPELAIGADPHDIRVDGQGNVFWDDIGANSVIHKIAANSLLETTYVGAVTGKACSTGDKYGDGCPANDGAADTGTITATTTLLTKGRGIGVGYNGDLFFADYTGDEDHRVSAATGLFTIIAGIQTTAPAAGSAPVDGPSNGIAGTVNNSSYSSTLNSSRGIGVDSLTGNVYVADTGDNLLRVLVPSNSPYCTGGSKYGCYVSSTVTQFQATVTAGGVLNNVPANQEVLDAPEDAQVDIYGNVFVTEQANGVVMAIYNGTGPFFNIANPVKGNIYVVAGNSVALATGTFNGTYPNDGTTPTVPATTVNMSVRKIGLDTRGNLYIADSSNNVVWFVDRLTGYLRLIAGHFQPTPAGGTAITPSPLGCPANPATTGVGDGCPGPDAMLTDASDMGTAPDNQGNLYITDPEPNLSSPRLRKLLSGLNFPATALAASVTQTVAVHFAAGDTPAATAPFTISGTDFTLGTPSCTTNTPGTFGSGQAKGDNTTDCLVPVTFKPSVAGNDTATLTMTSTAGGVNSYLVTGTGTALSIAIDPGSITTLPATVANAHGVVYDGAGNAYIADTNNNRVLKYTAATQATTVFAGTGTAGYTGDNAAATAATLKAPLAVAIDTAGSVFIADTGNNVIRKVNAAGVITTFGGGGAAGCPAPFDSLGNGCLATQATFSSPSGLATDNKGVVYVADTGNNLIRQINTFGFVSNLAGGASASGTCSTQTDTFGDGCAASQSTFKAPTGLAFDFTGNALVVADTGNNIVRQIALTNSITTKAGGGVTAAQVNPVTLLAGNGNPGDSIDVNSVATLSQLSAPTAVAVDAAENIYIADTANSAVRLVTHAAGTISTIVGINAANGNTTISGSATATSVLLTTPGGIAITPNGTLLIADSGNSRLLTDARSQATFNFGILLPNTTSSQQTFTQLNIGNTTVKLPTPLVVATGNSSQFSFTEPSGSAGCAANETFAPGAACIFQGQFTPSALGNYSANYTETFTTAPAGGAPSVTLKGIAAVLTVTTSSVTQTAPATGNSQFGGAVTLSVTVSAPCNTVAPSCYPTGAVQLIVDSVSQAPLTLSSTGTASQSFSGLSVGPHTVSCNYSGDSFYAAGSCPVVTVTVAPASTTALLSATNNNQPQYNSNASDPVACPVISTKGDPNYGNSQCTATTLTATVVSNTSGNPTGTVTFLAGTTALGTAPLNSTTGVATISLYYYVDPNGNIVSDASLAPGTYTLTCTYSGASNFASTKCASVTYTVLPHPVDFTVTAIGCVYNDLYILGTNTPGKGITCQPSAQTTLNGSALVATADGSTTDATIFIAPSNTFAGTLTFSCSGLPQYSACTFSPTSIPLTAGTTYAAPVYTDMTLWTDIQPGTTPTSSLRGPSIGHGSKDSGVRYAMMLGWPLTVLGFVGLLIFRRRKPGSLRGLSLLALVLVMTGSSLIFTGCAGPGAYSAVLTPAGTYPITVKVTGNGVSQTTIVYFKVSSPGIAGQE